MGTPSGEYKVKEPVGFILGWDDSVSGEEAVMTIQPDSKSQRSVQYKVHELDYAGRSLPFTPCPAVLHEGMNMVVAFVAFEWIVVLSGWWMRPASIDCVPVEYS